ncbi:MAG: FMN-binding negative transcriptional regulator [Planctomycetes bacterium]|nr:FMN-binding negative transcriptional regulator [Planctomycetota bacterium]
MYIPPHFAESNPAKLHDFIERHSFGLLVSHVAGTPFASHIPFLLDRTAGPHGTLIGHVARANPHWKDLANQTALAVFSGPHAYISPTWYESANVVPTWNYAAVHATGLVKVIEDKDSLLEIVQRSVAEYEANMPNPWTLDTSGSFVERLLAQIVGFRIEIATLEGKFKMSQNHPVERREKVIRALLNQGDENSLGVAEMMRGLLPEKG